MALEGRPHARRWGHWLAAGAALAASAHAPAAAQSSASLERVVVTGSHMPRIDAETALPVQVITREEIERSGVTTPAQLLDRVPANLYGFNDASSIQQAGTPGMSTANLRGLGDGSTLVLLNGRRLANYAFYGAAVDINSIPLSAVERVEILKDGASAIYGSDAIAGVINFVLRKDYTGAEITAYGTMTEHGGGNTYLATGTFGFGNLVADRYNAFVSASFQKNESLGSLERDYASTAYRPDLPRNFLSPITFPANIVDTVRRRNLNPTFAQGCTPPTSLPVPPPRAHSTRTRTSICCPAWNAPASWAWNVADRLGDGTVCGSLVVAQYFRQVHRAVTDPERARRPKPYPAGGPYYPTQFAAANGLSGDLLLAYRTAELGPRRNAITSEAQRYAVGVEGRIDVGRGWDYSLALTYNRNTQSDEYVAAPCTEPSWCRPCARD